MRQNLFFFSYSRQQDAKLVYAKVLNYFVIFCVFIFLLVTLFIDFFQYFVGEAYRSGLTIVPILLIANLCLGIHVNLSIWYKLTDRTGLGAWLSIAGALLTITLNYYWIPLYGYTGAAWATLMCYGAMAMVSYLLGQLYYPVAYDIKRLIGYITLGISLFKAKEFAITYSSLNAWLVSGLLLTVYLLFVVLFEKPAKRVPVSC
ncbi:oligosaccharide flippase family protein [Methylocucumis oryzae]|uniref:oligosaccharide flippase family protein n=1 Tax=Methylocucumis oryzae TaxID=1632867 RepID=UPI000AA75D7E